MLNFFTPSTWSLYTKKMLSKLDSLPSAGSFTESEAELKNFYLAQASSRETNSQSKLPPPYLHLYLLVDKEDGLIADAKYQAMVDSLTLALLEITLAFLLGKTYSQVGRMTPQLLYKNTFIELPFEEVEEELTLICTTLHTALESCKGIVLTAPTPSPLPSEIEESRGNYPGWLQLSKEEKIKVIEEVFDKEIRPYVELDEGGVRILDLTNDYELLIAYQGACTSCYSAVGTTLTAIQQILREKVHAEIQVIPQL